MLYVWNKRVSMVLLKALTVMKTHVVVLMHSVAIHKVATISTFGLNKNMQSLFLAATFNVKTTGSEEAKFIILVFTNKKSYNKIQSKYPPNKNHTIKIQSYQNCLPTPYT